jgi:hypothetical protein
MDTEKALHEARALVLRDLRVCGAETPEVVSVVEDAVAERRWWVEQWPDGAEFVAGLVAQDVQEALGEAGVRWPQCPLHVDTEDDHPMSVEPELGADPHWVCEKDLVQVAEVGEL